MKLINLRTLQYHPPTTTTFKVQHHVGGIFSSIFGLGDFRHTNKLQVKYLLKDKVKK